MKQGIFRRIFIIYAVVALSAGLFIELYITSAVRERRIDSLREHLSDNINLIAKSVSFGESNLDDLCREIKNDVHARVTVIAGDGRVIGDSDHDSKSMENHFSRTEIQQAALAGSGMAVRYSDTMQYDFLYIASKISRHDREQGFIRLAVPLKEVDRAVNVLRGKIIAVVLAVLFVTWAVSFWQTDQLRRLLRQIRDFSRSLSAGDIDKRLLLHKAGEFSEIADNITAMSARLKGILAESEEERSRLGVILASVPDALLIIDAKGALNLWSRSVKDFFGIEPEEGMLFAELVRNYEFCKLMEEVGSNRAPGMSEFLIEAPAEKHLAVRVSPLSYREGELSGYIAVFHDITGIRKLEQVRKDFVANVSHELKTPITAIKGFADTLLDGALEDKQNAVRFAQMIKSNSERINAIVDDLMTISRIELGVVRIEKSSTDVSGVFDNIHELFRDRASAKNLSIESRITPGCRQIEADRDRLIQILSNLIDNAIKFTETGGVTFGIDREGQRCFFFVHDTGIGVPAKFIPRLGERFFRVDPARSRKMGGTGLGLAIVKHLVKAHGWHLEIKSVMGSGTTVRVYI